MDLIDSLLISGTITGILCRSDMSKNPTSYSRGPGFKSWINDWESWWFAL